MSFVCLPASNWQCLAGAASAAALLVIIYASLIERFWIEERRVRVVLDRLPHAFSGTRITLLSDIHLGAFYGRRSLSRVVKLVNRSQPDIICLVGDLVSKRAAWGYQGAVRELSSMQAGMKKLAVLGNNDCEYGRELVKADLESCGFEVLINDCLQLGEGKERLFLVGLDEYQVGRPRPDLAISGVPEGECCIFMVHEPDCADYLQPNYDIDLQLSGHSHGGQFCLPGIGPIMTTNMGRRYISGLYRLGRMQLYTTRGIGTTFLPMRLFCRPEISILELKAPEQS